MPNDASFQLVDSSGKAAAICGIPLVRAVTVFFHASGSPQSRAFATSLQNAVHDFLLNLSSQVKDCAPQCNHSLAGVTTCTVCSDVERVKLLVLVGDEESFVVSNESWWLTPDKNRKVLPVYKAGSHPERWLSKDLSVLNAFFWQQSVTEAANTVLSAAAVTSDAYRLFISYRRLETEPLAEQLFAELNKHGFDVFLDRFSVPAAVQFQRRLHHELAEKSMVLMLESDRFGESTWTTEEIAYCTQYRLGLYVLRMPHGLDPAKPAKKLPSVDDDIRYTLAAADFVPDKYPRQIDTGKPGAPDLYLQWGPLTDAALQRTINQIKDRHNQSQLKRLDYMREQMLDTLGKAGASQPRMRADGMFSVSGAKKQYAVWITTRPPELPDFHVTHGGSLNPAGTVGVIVGHRQLLEPDIHQRLVWLSGVCRLVLVDEGDIVPASYAMAGGAL